MLTVGLECSFTVVFQFMRWMKKGTSACGSRRCVGGGRMVVEELA